MKLRATYLIKDANPFVPSFTGFLSQFKYAEADVPDDYDVEQMEKFAKEKTPEGFVFLKLEEIRQ